MSSKQARQTRDAEANKAKRAAARRERESKRAAATTEAAASAPAKSHSQSQSIPRKSRPEDKAISYSETLAYEPEDRDGKLAMLLMACTLALLALLIIAVLKAA